MIRNSLSGPQQRLEFAYDWMGRRIQKIVSTNFAGTFVPVSTNRFVYDGWNLIAVLDGNNTPLLSFSWGLDLSGSLQGAGLPAIASATAGGVGGLLSVTVHSGDNAGTYFYCYDGNGNVVALVNAADGSISASYEYGPFGEVLRATGPMAKANPFRFSTKYQDDETDLLYFGYRYYNASTGRWPSRDPIGEFGDGQDAEEQRVDLNLYVMLRNDSVNLSDYLGLKPNCCPNPKPVDAIVAAHDAPGASRGDKIPRNANVAQLLGHIANDVQPGECLRRLSISAHGNSGVIAIGGNDGDAPSPPYDPRGRVNGDISVDESNAQRIGQRIKNLVCLCKPCEIYILSCHVGLGKIGQGLANGSGCTVYAPNGFCCPNYKNPDKSKIKPKSRHYPDYNPPGSGDCFVKFTPQ